MNSFEGVTALIVEDDSVSVSVLQRMLNQLGIPSSVLSDHVVEGELAYTPRPAVIFLDLEMPAVSGYGVLEMIQSTPHLEGVPVVAYTTHISHMNETRTAGFDGFLGKPLDASRFAEQLARILAGEGVWEVA